MVVLEMVKLVVILGRRFMMMNFVSLILKVLMVSVMSLRGIGVFFVKVVVDVGFCVMGINDCICNYFV